MQQRMPSKVFRGVEASSAVVSIEASREVVVCLCSVILEHVTAGEIDPQCHAVLDQSGQRRKRL